MPKYYIVLEDELRELGDIARFYLQTPHGKMVFPDDYLKGILTGCQLETPQALIKNKELVIVNTNKNKPLTTQYKVVVNNNAPYYFTVKQDHIMISSLPFVAGNNLIKVAAMGDFIQESPAYTFEYIL